MQLAVPVFHGIVYQSEHCMPYVDPPPQKKSKQKNQQSNNNKKNTLNIAHFLKNSSLWKRWYKESKF